MITKDELERLKKPQNKNAELHYTIGGAVETAVHFSVESERIGKLQKGQRVMNEAVEGFRNNMAFKTREGLARSQFQANTPPKQDRALAENTWRQNHKQVHEDRFKQTSDDLKQQTSAAFQNEASTTKKNIERPTPRSERVGEFNTQLKQQNHKNEQSR